MKINWSGRAHDYQKSEIDFLVKIIKKADPLTQGEYLKKFESDFAKYLGKKNVFAVSSAASALELIAILMNFKKNDEVIIPAHTYCASAIPFARNKAKIIWSDINLDTRTVNLDDIEDKITKKTKAIVIVHLYGYAVNFSKLRSICKKRKIKIIEDCAQALGAEINGKKVGSMGDFSCFSFHAQKNITTLGEGGMLFVKDKYLANKVKGLRHNGHTNFSQKKRKYWLPAMGNLDLDMKNFWPFKFTLSEIQCGAGIVMLKRLKTLNNLRIKRAKKVIKSLSNYPELKFNESFKKNRHVYHLLSALYKPTKRINRNDLFEILYSKYNIKCSTQYYPLYRYSLFKKMGLSTQPKCKNTDYFYDNMISFPFHVWMNNNQLNYMIKSIKNSLDILRKRF